MAGAVLDPPRTAASHSRSTRDVVVDLACMAIALLLGVAILADEIARGSLPGWQIAADVTTGLACTAALWWRRSRPVELALAMIPLAAVSSAASGPAVIALFTLAVHRPVRIVAAVSVLSLTAVPVYRWLHPDAASEFWFDLGFAVLCTLAVSAWGMYVRARRELLASLRERAERAEAEQALQMEQARQQERARIAREMHDVLAHRISLLSMHAGALEFRGDASPEEVARAAGVIRASAHDALQDLREVIGVLRVAPEAVAPERPQPTLADLETLVEESRAAGMHIEARVEVGGEVPEATGRNAYRIAQEGLTNARKHAHGAAVVLTVRGAPGDGLEVEVRNRVPAGVGAAAIPGSGSGMIGLAERAHLAGGRLEHGRTAAGDHRLWAWLPWPA